MEKVHRAPRQFVALAERCGARGCVHAGFPAGAKSDHEKNDVPWRITVDLKFQCNGGSRIKANGGRQSPDVACGNNPGVDTRGSPALNVNSFDPRWCAFGDAAVDFCGVFLCGLIERSLVH